MGHSCSCDLGGAALRILELAPGQLALSLSPLRASQALAITEQLVDCSTHSFHLHLHPSCCCCPPGLPAAGLDASQGHCALPAAPDLPEPELPLLTSAGAGPSAHTPFSLLQKGRQIIFPPGSFQERLTCYPLTVSHPSCIDSWFEVNRSCPEHPAD